MQAGEIFYNHISPTSSVCFLRSECICLRIQGMIHTDDECTLKRAVVLSNPPTVRVQLGECCNGISSTGVNQMIPALLGKETSE